MNDKKLKVIIGVSGGVAEVEFCPDSVEVEIRDYDNINEESKQGE